MKRLKIIFTLTLICTAFIFTSCEKEKTSNQVILDVFGPTPVLRGDSLTFIGENLDKVTKVVYPNDITIDKIKVISSNEIMVEVPQESTEGHLVLHFPNGTITTKSVIGFTEPYEIKSLSPTDKAIREGDILTITGDYLWDIVYVTFMPGTVLDTTSFTEHTRNVIKVLVPKAAISGKIKIADSLENELYSDMEILVLQPKVTSATPTTVKAGKDITLTGTDLDLIAYVTFPDGTEVEITETTVVSNTSLTIEVPVTSQDGAISYTAYSGIEETMGSSIEMVVPTGLQVSATNYKAGETLTIAGTDLDLVTGVSFNGEAVAEFTYANNSISGVIPATATDGVITLSTAAKKSVTTTAITLVKPAIASLNPTTAVAGEANFSVRGTDLDLVSTVKLNGVECEFTKTSQTELSVKTVATSSTGKVEVIAANGDSNTSVSDMTITYNLIAIVDALPASAKIGDVITMTGSNFSKIESIFFGDKKVSEYTSRSDTEIKFTIPDVPPATYNMKFVFHTGETENCVRSIEVTGAVTAVEIWAGSTNMGGWSANQGITADKFTSLPSGSKIILEFTVNTGETYAQVRIMNSSWAALASSGSTVLVSDTATTQHSFIISDADLATVKASGMILDGEKYTLTKVYATY